MFIKFRFGSRLKLFGNHCLATGLQHFNKSLIIVKYMLHHKFLLQLS